MDAEFEESIADQNSVEPAYKRHHDSGRPDVYFRHNRKAQRRHARHTIVSSGFYRPDAHRLGLSLSFSFRCSAVPHRWSCSIFGNVIPAHYCIYAEFRPSSKYGIPSERKDKFRDTVPAMLQFMLFAPDVQKKDL